MNAFSKRIRGGVFNSGDYACMPRHSTESRSGWKGIKLRWNGTRKVVVKEGVVEMRKTGQGKVIVKGGEDRRG